MPNRFKIIIYFGLLAYLLAIYTAISADYLISKFSKNFLFSQIENLPQNKVGVILGTSKYLVGGDKNNYFIYRVDAAVKLYKNKKIDFILVSGDNATMAYNEPITFKKELLKRGIPEEKIFLDYAGFRTFDSMIRAKEVFGQSNFTVISQNFHNARAVFIARKYGIQAIGYNARDVSAYNGFKTQIREKFARVKVLLDIYILHTKPKFLGEKIQIQ